MNEATHLAAEALRRVVDEATVGELSFPTSVDASRRVMKAVENPDVGLDALAKIVVAEPLLSAKVIRLANSVALNPGGNPVRDVKQAVLRVGMDPTSRWPWPWSSTSCASRSATVAAAISPTACGNAASISPRFPTCWPAS